MGDSTQRQISAYSMLAQEWGLCDPHGRCCSSRAKDSNTRTRRLASRLDAAAVCEAGPSCAFDFLQGFLAHQSCQHCFQEKTVSTRWVPSKQRKCHSPKTNLRDISTNHIMDHYAIHHLAGCTPKTEAASNGQSCKPRTSEPQIQHLHT